MVRDASLLFVEVLGTSIHAFALTPNTVGRRHVWGVRRRGPDGGAAHLPALWFARGCGERATANPVQRPPSALALTRGTVVVHAAGDC